MGDETKRLRMFAGPNGSGKTTLVRKLAQEMNPAGFFSLHHFVNADDLLRAILGEGIDFRSFGLEVSWEELRNSLIDAARLDRTHPFFECGRIDDSRLTAPEHACDAYVAASVADYLREELLACGHSFSFETVMSHPNKIEFFARARTEGYRTYLYFIATELAVINAGRVEERVARGGHNVPPEKILSRYERSLQLARQAIPHAHRAYIFDNSGAEPVWLAEFDPHGECRLKIAAEKLPNWFRTFVWTP